MDWRGRVAPGLDAGPRRGEDLALRIQTARQAAAGRGAHAARGAPAAAYDDGGADHVDDSWPAERSDRRCGRRPAARLRRQPRPRADGRAAAIASLRWLVESSRRCGRSAVLSPWLPAAYSSCCAGIGPSSQLPDTVWRAHRERVRALNSFTRTASFPLATASRAGQVLSSPMGRCGLLKEPADD